MICGSVLRLGGDRDMAEALHGRAERQHVRGLKPADSSIKRGDVLKTRRGKVQRSRPSCGRADLMGHSLMPAPPILGFA
jgi:hypothetical protein